MTKRKVVGAYLKRYAPYRWTLASSAALSVLQSLLLVLLAVAIKLTFDRVLAKSGFHGLLLPSAIILVVATGAAILAMLARDRAFRATKIVVQEMRLDLFAAAYARVPFRSLADLSSLHSTIVQDTERVDVGSNAVIAVALPSLITATIFLVALIVLAPVLLLAALCAAPLAVLSHWLLGRRLQIYVTQFRESFETFDENTYAALERLDLTQLRGAREIEIARQTRLIDRLRRISGRMAWTAASYSLTQGWIVSVVGATTLLVGGSAVAAGAISLSGLAAYYFVLTQLGSSLNALWGVAPQILAGLDSLVNIARIGPDTRTATGGGARRHRVEGGIEISGLQFSYGPEPLLDEIDLTVAPGERVAIVGANGSGKSTLVHLLLGLLTPQAGEIRIDGVPLSTLDHEDYRRQVGVMLQDNLLFPGSLFENIAYGCDRASLEDARRAAVLARADNFVRTMPGGYETVIAGLSGGQGQMLGLARAFLGRPALLILDEPTNHLDVETANALFDGLDAAGYRPSILLITHDRALAARFDRCLALQNGRLVSLHG